MQEVLASAPEVIAIGRRSDEIRASRVLIFFAAHVALAMAIRQFRWIGTVHEICALCVGLWWAMRGRQLERVAHVGAYVAGAEVLWRMNFVEIFWEFGKYSTVAMYLIALLRFGRLKGSRAAGLYLLFLAPSVAMTIVGLEPARARQQISFNLSGPLALMFSVWFFSNLKLSKAQLHRIFLAYMGPTAGIAGLAIMGTLAAGMIRFNGQSNVHTSGGFGPNQVAAVLGLAAFFAFFYLLHDKTSARMRALLIASVVVFAAQSAMTFSRGGLYAAAGSAALAGVFLIRQKKGTARLLQVAPALFLITVYVVVPQIVAFTGGAITERFQKTSLTRRGDLMQADVEMWRENPIFGVGPGMGSERRGKYGEHMAAHTEFTRLLSEHGLMGIAALLVLFGIGLKAFLRARGPASKALASSLMAWSLFYMFANGMRVVAPSFTFGLACATVLQEKRIVRRIWTAVPDEQTSVPAPAI